MKEKIKKVCVSERERERNNDSERNNDRDSEVPWIFDIAILNLKQWNALTF